MAGLPPKPPQTMERGPCGFGDVNSRKGGAGMEVNLKTMAKSILINYGDHLSLSKITQVDKLQVEFSYMFLHLISVVVYSHHYQKNTGG